MALTHLSGLQVGDAGLVATGPASTTLGTVTIGGDASLLGKVTGDSSWCGVRKIATGGSATILCPNTAAGPIIVTPLFGATSGTAVRRRIATVVNRSATAFKVLLHSPTGTVAAGTVSWAVVNV